ncbi:hypothetical protein BG011_003614 [Mortierella polycephala]|uniref:Uncharacterized protein n=1 Tax=Mortierella polycephala TaxID=41804 RepID=A0A9P6Q4M2_9FUNG|nr:hypothetical protein BG011_003614 [Mortierella polycephala]
MQRRRCIRIGRELDGESWVAPEVCIDVATGPNCTNPECLCADMLTHCDSTILTVCGLVNDTLYICTTNSLPVISKDCLPRICAVNVPAAANTCIGQCACKETGLQLNCGLCAHCSRSSVQTGLQRPGRSNSERHIPSQLLELAPLLEAILKCADSSYIDCSGLKRLYRETVATADANAKLNSLTVAPKDVKVNAMIVRLKEVADDIKLVFTNGENSILNKTEINVNRIIGDTGAKSKIHDNTSQLFNLVNEAAKEALKCEYYQYYTLHQISVGFNITDYAVNILPQNDITEQLRDRTLSFLGIINVLPECQFASACFGFIEIVRFIAMGTVTVPFCILFNGFKQILECMIADTSRSSRTTIATIS